MLVKEGADKDHDFANMIYGTRHNTQKNLVAVRSYRRSLKGSSVVEEATLGSTTVTKLPQVGNPAHIRMNRTSALSGFGESSGLPLKATNPVLAATTSDNFTF